MWIFNTQLSIKQCLFISILLVNLASSVVLGSTSIGQISDLKLSNVNSKSNLQIHQPIYYGDEFKVGDKGFIRLKFINGTLIQINEKSHVIVERLYNNDKEGFDGVRIRVLSGSYSLIDSENRSTVPHGKDLVISGDTQPTSTGIDEKMPEKSYGSFSDGKKPSASGSPLSKVDVPIDNKKPEMSGACGIDGCFPMAAGPSNPNILPFIEERIIQRLKNDFVTMPNNNFVTDINKSLVKDLSKGIAKGLNKDLSNALQNDLKNGISEDVGMPVPDHALSLDE